MSDLIKHLLNKGLTQEDAQKLADGFSSDSVELDALNDAINDLSKAMKLNEDETLSKAKGSKKAMKQEEEDEEDGSSSEDMLFEQSEYEDEDEDEDEKSMHKAMEAMAKGTDAILDTMDKQYKAMMKALDACLKEMQSMKKVDGKVQEMEKSINKALLSPVPPKAVLQFNDVPYAQQQAKVSVTRGDVINKAMNMLKDDKVDFVRKGQLVTAIAKLESGVDALQVAKDYEIEIK
jgi:myosin heavy subunit